MSVFTSGPGTVASDANLAVTDVTTNNASTSAHGFLKKLDNSAAHFMDGQGNWSTPTATASPKMRQCCDFSATSRFGTSTAGSGTFTVGSQGGTYDTTATANSAVRSAYQVNSNTGMSIFAGNPTFATNVSMPVLGAANGLIGFAGLGLVTINASGMTTTEDHAGFKIVRESGVYNLYATQANGTTETVSSVLTTLTTSDSLNLIVVVNTGSSCDYYWSKNNGSLSSATNLSTNNPTSTAATNHITFGVSNIANAFEIDLIFGGFTFER